MAGEFGCGRGAWLRAALDLGIHNILGMDGDYVSPESLLIPVDRFVAVNLTRPFRVPARYDLAMCLEVAEHLPARAAASLVDGLTSAAPVVLFSAAIPGQPGTHHINSQFPEYWQHLFCERGFVALDVVRPLIRSDSFVEPWYAQNILLYVSREFYDAAPRLHPYRPLTSPAELLPWVYAELWRGRMNWRGPLSVFKIVVRKMFGR